jgi:hypothetical protein
MAQVPSFSVKYAANGGSIKSNEMGMRAMQEHPMRSAAGNTC